MQNNLSELPTLAEYKLAAVERAKKFGFVATAKQLAIGKSSLYRWWYKRDALRAQVAELRRNQLEHASNNAQNRNPA
jgi:hypothetical protein